MSLKSAIVIYLYQAKKMKTKKTNLNKLSAILIFLLFAASISTVVAGNGASQEQQIGQTNQNTSIQDSNQAM